MSQGLAQGHAAHGGLAGRTGLRPPALRFLPRRYSGAKGQMCLAGFRGTRGQASQCYHKLAGATLVESCDGEVGSWEDRVVLAVGSHGLIPIPLWFFVASAAQFLTSSGNSMSGSLWGVTPFPLD